MDNLWTTPLAPIITSNGGFGVVQARPNEQSEAGCPLVAVVCAGHAFARSIRAILAKARHAANGACRSCAALHLRYDLGRLPDDAAEAATAVSTAISAPDRSQLPKPCRHAPHDVTDSASRSSAVRRPHERDVNASAQPHGGLDHPPGSGRTPLAGRAACNVARCRWRHYGRLSLLHIKPKP